MKRAARTSSALAFLLVTTMVVPGPAWGQGDRVLQPSPDTGQALGGEWVALNPQLLDDMRGGFIMPSGLALSFGIERVVYVNGALVATASLHIPDISTMTTEQALALGEMNKGLVVQIGDGNDFNAAGGLGGIVVQNTLDGQQIQTLTTLNVSVNTLGLFQDLNAYSGLQGGLLSAVGSP